MSPPRFLRSLLPALVVAIALTTSSVANVVLAPPFADHGVLQREKPIPVWGTAAAGEKITVSLGNDTRQIIASANGKWGVTFDARPANASGVELSVRGENALTVTDLLVGEVWFCSGQSNMTFPVERSDRAQAEIAAAHFPLIRQFSTAQTPAAQPADSVKGAWRICAPETAGRFSAVGFYFARELYEELNVPIGIVLCAWGGTPIESWISPTVLKSQPAFSAVAERWANDLAARPANEAAYNAILKPWLAAEAVAKRDGEKTHQAYLAAHPRPVMPSNIRDASAPSSLYNGMVHPLVPFSFRGVLWYQGEGNTAHPEEYHALFVALITSWRADFGHAELPFYWVNLANYKGDQTGLSSAKVREAQTETLTLPQTGQALAIDIGNPNDIHPTNKKEVGRRLALIAKAHTYGRPIEFSGPQFVSATPEGAAMRVRLSHAEGLVARGGTVHSLQLAGADQKFYPASATLNDSGMLVSAPGVKAPVAVRYAFANSPNANLYNGANLPAVPFRSDRW